MSLVTLNEHNDNNNKMVIF